MADVGNMNTKPVPIPKLSYRNCVVKVLGALTVHSEYHSPGVTCAVCVRYFFTCYALCLN